MVALVIGAPAHARCIAGQTAAACWSILLAESRKPPDAVHSAKPPTACTSFEITQEARNAGTWSTLDFVPPHAPAPIEAAEAELKRIGGLRLVLKVDAEALHKGLIERGRDDVRRLMREAKVSLISAPRVRGHTLDLQVKDRSHLLRAIAPLISGPLPGLAVRSVAGEHSASGFVSLVVTDRARAERLQTAETVASEYMLRRISELGLDTGAVQALESGRFLVVAPGLKESERLTHLMPSFVRLTFQIANGLASPCTDTQAPADFEVLSHHATRASLLVKQRPIAHGEDVASVAVALDAKTRTPTVVVRLNASASRRMHVATRDNVGQPLAIVLDSEVIAAPVVREPIESGLIRISGDLTLQQAGDFALLVRAGLLPPPLTIVEQQIVEPKVVEPR
jgi:SecD/SecF fusion protein